MDAVSGFSLRYLDLLSGVTASFLWNGSSDACYGVVLLQKLRLILNIAARSWNLVALRSKLGPLRNGRVLIEGLVVTALLPPVVAVGVLAGRAHAHCLVLADVGVAVVASLL